MKSTSLLCVLAVIGAAVLALTGAAMGQNNQAPQAGPKLAIGKLEHSFGEVKKGAVATHTFTFRNEGKADLEIKSVAPS